MNKKNKLANKKHRKTKKRLKILKEISLKKAKKKPIVKTKVEPVVTVDLIQEEQKASPKKIATKKSPTKKTATKKSPIKKKVKK